MSQSPISGHLPQSKLHRLRVLALAATALLFALTLGTLVFGTTGIASGQTTRATESLEEYVARLNAIPPSERSSLHDEALQFYAAHPDGALTPTPAAEAAQAEKIWPLPEALPLPMASLATPAPVAPQVVYLAAPPAPLSIESRITAWGAVATLAILTIASLAGLALKKAVELQPLVDALTHRQDRQSIKTGSLEEKLFAVATSAARPASDATPESSSMPGGLFK